MTDFIYSPLPNDSIRLLQFSTNEAGDQICTMNNVILAQSPPFYALSYTWGSEAATESISCNGLTLKIRPNLHDAIRTLFSPPLSLNLPIWIDAMSINQNDDEEKAVQVSRMGDIYRKAKQVVVWLGPSGQDSDLAIDWLERMSVALPKRPSAVMVDYKKLEEYGLPAEYSPAWTGLGHLFRRPWFGRLWTFQEAVLAADLLFICGQKTISYEILVTVARELRRLNLHWWCVRNKPMEHPEDGFRAMQTVGDARASLKSWASLRFDYLLGVACTKACFDPRDRAYAVLGMTGPRFRSRIRVLYSQDYVQTYIDCSKACIAAPFPMILELVAGRKRIPGLPSWCPNLNSNEGTNQQFSDWHRAGILGEAMTYELFRGQTTAANNNLAISGFRVDRVSEVAVSIIPPISQQLQQWTTWARNFVAWEEDCLALAQRITSEALPMAHVYALVAHTSRRLPDVKDEDLRQAYLDNVAHMNSVAQNKGSKFPPQERQELFRNMWHEISYVCQGRRYFGTEKGRLGFGPLDVKKGDMVCILYGSRPVYILREVEGKTEECMLIGDAYINGMMVLSETPQSVRGLDEVFTIV